MLFCSPPSNIPWLRWKNCKLIIRFKKLSFDCHQCSKKFDNTKSISFWIIELYLNAFPTPWCKCASCGICTCASIAWFCLRNYKCLQQCPPLAFSLVALGKGHAYFILLCLCQISRGVMNMFKGIEMFYVTFNNIKFS